VIKPLASSLLLYVCFWVPAWIGRDVGAVDGDAIEHETQNALQKKDLATVDRNAIEREIQTLRESNVATVDRDAIEQEIRNALREIETQLPELVKSIRINVHVPEINVHIPEIHVPEIQIPTIHVQAPTEVQIPEIKIPEINIPEIRIQIPKIDVDTRDSSKLPPPFGCAEQSRLYLVRRSLRCFRRDISVLVCEKKKEATTGCGLGFCFGVAR